VSSIGENDSDLALRSSATNLVASTFILPIGQFAFNWAFFDFAILLLLKGALDWNTTKLCMDRYYAFATLLSWTALCATILPCLPVSPSTIDSTRHQFAKAIHVHPTSAWSSAMLINNLFKASSDLLTFAACN